jgi:hypothetical protein
MITNTRKTFSHSGNLGDIIWALPTIAALGGGDLYLVRGGVNEAIGKYDNGPPLPEYEGRLTQTDIDLITPILKQQPYISSVNVLNGEHIDYDLDMFRKTVGKEFKTNFLETYALTFGLPYNKLEFAPWLTAEPNRVARYVVARAPRAQSNRTRTIPMWLSIIRMNQLEQEAVFVGLPSEHSAFRELFDVQIPYYECRDFLALANVIAGADAFVSNSTFAYSIAQGLGKPTVTELVSWRPMETNECLIPRDDCFYF